METKRLHSNNNNNKDKKLKRKKVLEKKRAIDEIIKAAYAEKDHLVSFQPFRQYDRNGVCVYLESGSGEHLCSHMKRYIQSLLKVNMEGPYGSEWPTEEKVKRKEMVAPEACYVFVRAPNVCDSEISRTEELGLTSTRYMGEGDPFVGFVQYRFIVEEEVPVLYVYELQLEIQVQGRGLGKFLMQLIELIARKNRMGAVMLTVQKANSLAMNFYMSKLRYIISTISPSRVDPLIGAEKSYEILCKAFDHEAKAKLEKHECKATDLPIKHGETPVNNLAPGSLLDSSPGKAENSTTANTTPPVQASISPEIQCRSSLISTPTCFGAGHVLSGGTDKKKYRPKGGPHCRREWWLL